MSTVFNRVVLFALLAQTGPFAAADSFNEPLRPQYHFSPAKNWTNDPNGLVYYKGEYHLFYQHNPFGDKWGHMSWGHAVSRDMVHWQHLPVALAEESGVMIFSGSVVVDKNTSGMCTGGAADCLVAIYTGHTETKQAQHIAVSNDRGRTWTKFAGNPVLDLNLKDFRDPKVFWQAAGKYWVMVVSLPDEHKIRLYKSADLKAWDLMSDFGPAGSTAGNWECPDLFELPVEGGGGRKWVLSVNVMPGGPQGGSANQYFVGDFDGTRFTNANAASVTLWADYGADWYASTSFSDIPAKDGRRMWIGWLSNWLYANDEPTSPWRGLQSFPRVLSLRESPDGLRLVQQPIAELKRLRRSPIRLVNVTVEEANRKLAAFHGQSYEIEVDGATDVHLLKNAQHETVVGTGETVHIDRRRSGNVDFNKDFSKPHPSVAARDRHLRIFVDRSVVEVFANGGMTVLTDRVFPPESATGLALVGAPTDRVTVTVWKMASAWK